MDSPTGMQAPSGPSEVPTGASRMGSRRPSLASLDSTALMEKVGHQTEVDDEADSYTIVIILIAALVAVCCGIAAFILHEAVKLSGCTAGLNGCHEYVLSDFFKDELGVSTSVYFIVSCSLSALCCSVILYSPFLQGVGRKCKGGGAVGTKIMVASGQATNALVVPLRILLSALYMGGGNPLGTEGPIIHLATSLAMFLVKRIGLDRRKHLSIFGVVGAAAGISAGFNVIVTGFVYVIEELTRTLSRKLAMILAFAAAIASFTKDNLEDKLEEYVHLGHAYLVPDHKIWPELDTYEIRKALVLSMPIGVLCGCFGWIFISLAWYGNTILNPQIVGEKPSLLRRFLPEILHLPFIGLFVGGIGALCYEVTHINGVWGTSVGAIPEAISSELHWAEVMLIFFSKFFACILATAGGGPGGQLVPSLTLGGYLGIFVARVFDSGQNLTAASSVIGMGAMFASMMHMPLTGVIIVFELTKADNLILHVALANFIASNVIVRLPHGNHSFLHRSLTHDAVWMKIGQQDFIETDDQEKAISGALDSALKSLFMPDNERLRLAFEGWVALFCSGGDLDDLQDPDSQDTQQLLADSSMDAFASPQSPKVHDSPVCHACGRKPSRSKDEIAAARAKSKDNCPSIVSGGLASIGYSNCSTTYDPNGSVESICQGSHIALEESPQMLISTLARQKHNSREIVYGLRRSPREREIRVNVTIMS